MVQIGAAPIHDDIIQCLICRCRQVANSPIGIHATHLWRQIKIHFVAVAVV